MKLYKHKHSNSYAIINREMEVYDLVDVDIGEKKSGVILLLFDIYNEHDGASNVSLFKVHFDIDYSPVNDPEEIKLFKAMYLL